MMLAVQSFVCCLREELKTTDVYLYRKVLENLASCMEDFSLGRMTLNILSSVLACSTSICILVWHRIVIFTLYLRKIDSIG